MPDSPRMRCSYAKCTPPSSRSDEQDVAESMQAMDRHSRNSRDRVNAVTDLGSFRLTGSSPSSPYMPAGSSWLYPARKVCFETPPHHLRQTHSTLASGLAAIDAQYGLVAIELVEVQSFQLAPTEPDAIQHGAHRDPQMRAVVPAATYRLLPFPFNVS